MAVATGGLSATRGYGMGSRVLAPTPRDWVSEVAAEQAGPTHVSVDVGSEHRGPIGRLFSTARRTPDSGNEKEV